MSASFEPYFENDKFIVRFEEILTVYITERKSGKTYRGTGCYAVEAQKACFWSANPDAEIEEVFKVLCRPKMEDL